MCRATLRGVLRDIVAEEEPLLLESIMKSEITKAKKKFSLNHVKTFCISVDDDESDSGKYTIQSLVHKCIFYS